MSFSLSDAEIETLLLSLRVAGLATLVALPLGVFVAWALARFAFPGRDLIAGILHLPLVLPPVVTGYGLLVLFGVHGPVGAFLKQFGIVFAFDWTGAALAAGVMGFPLLVRAARLSFEAVDPGLEQAAATLGAPPGRRFFRVTLPLAAPGVVAGTVLSFAKAFGEFGATITFVSNIPGLTRTLPLAIYTFTQTPDGDAAAARLVIISVVVSIGAVLIAERVSRAVARRAAGL
ncbi:MAG TPA: molybdate ABC transporter permease subunit [Caulobacteraceae bacterium]|jgi:molybdate transport system permease protein|nr:molybdate ABC transporter permease subunit [Caulobacteraceae bacterium]